MTNSLFDPCRGEELCGLLPLKPVPRDDRGDKQVRMQNEHLRAENLMLREEIDQHHLAGEIVGASRALRRVLEQVDKVAMTDSTVLISGETGTGKELVARAIHRGSPRHTATMVKVNCAALPGSLVASELFGHEKGAFTGAWQRHIGRFELANNGTLFLDEVGELPPEIQVALLRVLQEGEFERVGGTQTQRTNVRLIAATNRSLASLIRAGSFRSDLFYRLNVFPIEVPPLRERREDIPLLVEFFCARFAARMGKRILRINKHTLDLLSRYDWPGNLRELQNIIERAVILTEGESLEVEESALRGSEKTSSNPLQSLSQFMAAQERGAIEAALRETAGRISGPAGAAARLGISSTTLESKIKSLGIDKYSYKTRAAAGAA